MPSLFAPSCHVANRLVLFLKPNVLCVVDSNAEIPVLTLPSGPKLKATSSILRHLALWTDSDLYPKFNWTRAQIDQWMEVGQQIEELVKGWKKEPPAGESVKKKIEQVLQGADSYLGLHT